jgi:DNA/RNA endonuclease YhcR with UshA esterase domain
MVTDKSLMRLSVIVSVVGIAMLIIAANFMKPQQYQVMDIRDDMLGKSVTLSGVVYSISEKNNNVFMNLYDGTGNIDVVAFNMADAVEAAKGENVTVYGKVALYNSRLEIIANEIK